MKYKIKVIPQSSKDEVKQEIDDSGNIYLKIKTTKPAQDGKANDAVIKILADHFKVKKSSVRIASGETSRMKVVEIL